MPDVIDDVVRRLYEEPPDGFVATRAAAVEEARTAGDRDTAKRLAALKKPTVAAWVVNLLARRRPDLISELVELSGALRAAQRELHGDQLRELSQQRRAFVSALVTAARKLATEAGASTAKLPLGEVEATLTAALADPETAAQVRTGRLIRATTYAGFGEVPRPRLRLITGGDPAEELLNPPESTSHPHLDKSGSSPWSGNQDHPSGTGDPGITAEFGEPGESAGSADAARESRETREAQESRETRESRESREHAARERHRRETERHRRDLERELNAAEAAERRADDQLKRAESAERDAEGLVDDLEAELAELERRRTEAVADVARRKLARRTAERESAAARRRVGDVQAALDDLS